MRLEDLKKNIPDTPEFVHDTIQSEVARQLRITNEVNTKKHRIKKWTVPHVAAAAAACVLATSTVAFAGVKLYDMYLEKRGNFGVVTGYKAEENTGKTDIPEMINDIELNAGYIPEGMLWNDKDKICLEYAEHNKTGGITFSSVLLDGDTNQAILDKDVVESEQRSFGKYSGVYVRYNDILKDDSYNQRIYLFCPDEYRVIVAYISDDVAKEDAVKVVENLKITKKDTMIKTSGMYTWSDMALPKEINSVKEADSIEDGKLPVHQIGDVFGMTASADTDTGYKVTKDMLSVKVDSVQVADDLKLLDDGKLPDGWDEAIGADGKLVDNTLYYIKSGDGINSVDEVVKTESVKQKLIYAKVTYTNNSDKEFKHLIYMGELMFMNHNDEGYKIYNPLFQSGDGYDRVEWNGVARGSEMTYCSVLDDYGNGHNYIPSLKPKESITVNMAWIINENDVKNMYLNLNSASSASVFTESTLDTGVVDIRKK